jgi:protein-disulfide isomerase
MKKIIAAALLGTLLAAAPLIAKPPVKARPTAARMAWDARLGRTAAGNQLIGNPAAKVQLVEFISYTCSHCAHFNAESKIALLPGLVRQGQVAVEVRPFFRNIVDVPATLLVQCGGDAQFLGNHHAILAAQETWLKDPTAPDVETRWKNPDFGLRMKAIAQDMGLYALMQQRGFTPAQLDRCLADKPLAQRLAQQTEDATKEIGVQGTPSFLINGKLQDVYGWNELQPLLAAALH